MYASVRTQDAQEEKVGAKSEEYYSTVRWDNWVQLQKREGQVGGRKEWVCNVKKR